MLGKPWISGIPSKKLCQPVSNCIYWPVLGPYNNWNIIDLSPKPLTFEAFDDMHKVVLDGISENTASLFQSGMYGAINTDDTTKMGDSMSFNSYWRYKRYKKKDQFMDKLFQMVNHLSRHNIFAP